MKHHFENHNLVTEGRAQLIDLTDDLPTRLEVPGLPVVLDRASTENFSVASLVLGKATRDHLLAIYGFARLVDQLGDEVEGDRLAHLDWLEADLDRAYDGNAEHPLMHRLSPTLHRFDLPRDPFLRLIEANRRDQEQTVYRTFDELLEYCDLSANPVGELVLHVFAAATAARVVLSNQICTALQLVEHWQDVDEDYGRGRIYIPAEDLERFSVAAGEFHGAAFKRLMSFEIARARALLDEGAPLVGTLRGRARLAIAGYVGGGRAALDALAAGRSKASKTSRAVATLKTFVRGR
jgi:squalene synthase HpnC